MCGRFTLRTPTKDIVLLFDLRSAEELAPRYNVAPTQNIAAVRHSADGPGRELVQLHWGLIPSWADDPSVGNRMINARSETLASKPAYREAFKSRRCLVVADGFYEWQRRGKAKQPYHFARADGQPVGFAGLWERWRGNGQTIESATVITTDANELVSPFHERMPAIVRPEDFELWLDPNVRDPARLEPLLRPYTAAEMVAFPVNPLVNKPTADSPECLAPWDEAMAEAEAAKPPVKKTPTRKAKAPPKSGDRNLTLFDT